MLLEDANKELARYIESFNRDYSVKATDDDIFYIPSPENLADILCAQFSRRADKTGCITFQGTQFYAPNAPDISHSDITVCINEHGVFAKYLEAYYPLIPVDHRVQQVYGENMPQVVVNIIYRYLYAFAKEISA